ncbi:Protein of unknown function [Massilia yuzhufengensis]|uniref:DUF1800 domain-containing protein n=2 Tax=Massilia yuzhufengensis TaxID=1164594 RepID=A0A1I1ICX6_9BURK|nr:Protein of unknown function [Massilia yuzhufengensis]
MLLPSLLLLLAMPGASAATAAATSQQALHLLNRLGYGPAPGDVARVRAMGLAAYVDSQLAPPALEPRLAARLREYHEAGTPADEERLLRAIASPRQLEEVLSAFWQTWFGMRGVKEPDVRPHVFGRYATLRTILVQGGDTRSERAALGALLKQFVSAPSRALEHALWAAWTATGGDQRAVLRALFRSPEFLAPSQHGSMRKDDWRFVVSALRASSVAVQNAAPLVEALRRPMGTAGRAAFAQQLAQGRLALAIAPPRLHRYASSAPPVRAMAGSAAPQAGVAQPGPVLIEAPTPSAAAMAAAARSQPLDPGGLLELLYSSAFARY